MSDARRLQSMALRTVGQKPVKAAKSLGLFRPPESLNCARIERMTPSMESLFPEPSIDGVIRSIRELVNDTGGRNMPRVLAAFTGFWPTVRASATLPLHLGGSQQQRPIRVATATQIGLCSRDA